MDLDVGGYDGVIWYFLPLKKKDIYRREMGTPRKCPVIRHFSRSGYARFGQKRPRRHGDSHEGKRYRGFNTEVGGESHRPAVHEVFYRYRLGGALVHSLKW